jgi:hypothetical protein
MADSPQTEDKPMIYRDNDQKDPHGRSLIETFMFRDEGRQLAQELAKLGIQAEIVEKAPCG